MNTEEYRKRIAEEFANLLEEKQLDWKKQWLQRDLPINGTSGRNYNGVNRFHLSLVAMERGYTDPRWMTFRQIQNRGWKLKNAKGKGVNIEYWYPYDAVEKKVLSWQEFWELKEQIGERYQLGTKYYTVFNAELVEGIGPYESGAAEEITVDEIVDKLSHNMNVLIENDGGGQAFYRVSDDTIHLPAPEDFSSSYAYNSVALHELTHATGAAHRLNRNITNGYGSPGYAFEELVAEISSCFMSSNLKIEQEMSHIQNHKAYVQSWIKSIREEPEAYMEYKAELITEKRFHELSHNTLSVNDSKIKQQKVPHEQAVPEAAWHLDTENYLYMKPSETGYDYTLYDRRFHVISEGHFEQTGLSAIAARDEIIKLQGLSFRMIDNIPLDEYRKLKERVDGEPVVIIDFTESDHLEAGKEIPLNEADCMIERLDREARDFFGREGYSYMIQFTIEYVKTGRIHTYEGRQNLGELEGSLIEHILDHATYHRDNLESQAAIISHSPEQQAELKARYDDTIDNFVPYLRMHKSLTDIERNAEESQRVLMEETSVMDTMWQVNLDYYDALKDYVRESRMELNFGAIERLPDRPELKDYIVEPADEYIQEAKQEITEEAESYGMTLDEYVDNGYQPYPDWKEEEKSINATYSGLQQIREDNQYFKDILTVQKYEKSIGRSESAIVRYSEEQLGEYAVQCREYLDFGNEVEQCLAGGLQARNEVKVCDMPELLIQAGCSPFPMHITQKHLRDCMSKEELGQPHYHTLTVEEMKRLPEALGTPALLAQAPSRKDAVIIILGYRDQEELPVLVSAVPDGKAAYNLQRVESNFITSEYGKDHIQEYVQQVIEKDQLIYINKEKSQELALWPIQSQQDRPAPVFDSIIKRIGTDAKEEHCIRGNTQSKRNESKKSLPIKQIVPKL